MSVTTAEETETINLRELGKKFIGGAMWMSAAQVGSYGLTFGANIFLARLLEPDVFGVFALATSILSIFYILGSWSFSVAVIQTEEMDQAFFDTAFALSLGLGGVLFGLVVLASFPLRAFYSDQVVRILLILAGLQVLSLLSGCYGATLKRDLEYKSVSLVDIGARVMGLIVAVGLARVGTGVWSLVGKQAIFVIGSFVGMYFISPWRFRWQFRADAAKRLFSFGSQMFFSSGLESFLSSAQGFLIGTMLGTKALGHFDRAIKLSQLGHTVAGPAVNQVSLAAYSRMQVSEDRLALAFETINYFLIRIFTLLGIGFLFYGKNITILLYGEDWHIAGRLLQFLFPYALLVTIFGNVKKLLVSQRKIAKVIKTRFLQSIILSCGLLIVLHSHGIFGAALMVDLTYLVGLILTFVATGIEVDIYNLWGPPLLAGFVVSIIFQSLRIWMQQNSVPGNYTVAVFGVCVICYLGSLWLLDGKRAKHNIGYLLKVTGVVRQGIE